MRKVRCCITKEYGTPDEFYCEDGKWYKSKEICEEAKHKQQLRNDVIQQVFDYIHYEDGQPVPSTLVKCLETLQWYGDEIVLRTLRQFDKQIRYYCDRKNFTSVNGHIKYIFAIVSSHIPDVYKVAKQEAWAEQHRSKAQPVEDFKMVAARHPVKTVSKFLEE